MKIESDNVVFTLDFVQNGDKKLINFYLHYYISVLADKEDIPMIFKCNDLFWKNFDEVSKSMYALIL